jgi:hypothetical protein
MLMETLSKFASLWLVASANYHWLQGNLNKIVRSGIRLQHSFFIMEKLSYSSVWSEFNIKNKAFQDLF